MIVVDRVEGDRAVLEVAGERVDFPVSALPQGVVEGSVLVFSLADPSDRLAEAEARLKRLTARGPAADLIDLSSDDLPSDDLSGGDKLPGEDITEL